MNTKKVLANEKGLESLNKSVSMKSVESEVIRLDCKNSEIEIIVQSLEWLNQELLKQISDDNKDRVN